MSVAEQLIAQGEKKGIQKGIQKGLDKGELVGEIRFAQKMLKTLLDQLEKQFTV